ncbi:unnamed protein product, partial [Closterium sp. NIES-53]
TTQAQYNVVVARYSSPATASLGRLLLPYLFPELLAFATIEDLVSHVRASDARYRAAVPTEFLAGNLPPMDHFLSLDPTSLTLDLLEQHLLASSPHGTPRSPFFEGCSPSPLAPSYASAAATDVSVAEDVGAASASAKHRSGKGKGGKGGGGGSGGGGGGSGSGGGGSSGGGGGGGAGGGSGGSGGGSGGSGGSGGGGGSGSGGGGTGARRVGSGRGQRQQQQRRSETQSPQQLREWFLRHSHVCHLHGIAIFDLDFDAILSAMYALSTSVEGDCYRCVLPDPGIAATASGASESGTLPCTAPAEALHTFTLDSSASRCFFRDSTTLTPLLAPDAVRLADPSGGPVVARSSTVLPCPAVPSSSLSGLHLPSFSTNLVSTAALQDAMVTTTTHGGQRVMICTCTRTGRHLATFTRRPGSSLYTLATKPPQVAASAQVSTLGQVAASCSCRLLSHQTLLWHHRLGQPSLPRLRGMHSRLLVSGLPRSLPPLPPSRAPHCLPCVEGRQRAAPHSSSFPPTTAPLLTLHMDVWGPARVSGQSREHFFLLVVDDYTRYTTVFPLRSRGEVVDVLIPWIRTVRLQLRERFDQDLPVLRLHSDRGGELSSSLLHDFCRGEGILQSLTLPESPQQNGIAERRIGLVMEVARTSMIHAAAPHFLWPFAVRYAVHQLNLWPRVSLPETSPTLRWTGKVGDASVFRVWGSRAFDESVPFYRLFPYRSAPPPPPPLFLAPGPPPIDPLPPQGPAPEGAGSGGAEPGGEELGGAEPVGLEPAGAESGGAEPRGAASSGGPDGASPRLSPQAGGAGDAGGGGDGVTASAGGTRGTTATGLGGARTRGAGAAGTSGVEGAGAGDPTEPGAAGAGGAKAVVLGAGGVGDTVRPRSRPLRCLLPLLTLRSPAVLQSVVSLRLILSCLFALPRCVPRSRPPPVPGTHAMALRPSSVPLRVLLPAPPESSLPEVPDPESDRARATSPTVARLLANAVTDPSFESAAAFALIVALLDFAATCHLDFATALVAESDSASPPSVGGECALGTDVLEDMQEEFECLAAAVPHFASMLLAPEGDPDAPDIPTPRSYAEAITGPYSSQRQAAMDAEMASWKVKRPPRSPPAFKARYVARGFSQRQGVDYFQTFSPTSKMTTLWVLLHVTAQRDYELHSLYFSTAFFLCRRVYVIRQTPREWHDTQRTTLEALGFAPSTADPSLFLSTDTSLPPFYVLVYVDDLVFATADTEALALALQRFGFQFSSPEPTPLSTSHSLSAPPSHESVEPSGLYLELVGCLMYLMTCTRPDLAYPLSLLARYVALGRHQKVHRDAAKRVLRYLCSTSGMGLVLGGQGLVVLTGHADASWDDNSATQRSSECYTFSLGSGSVSWRSTRSSLVLSCSCEAEIYAGQRGQINLAYVATRANTADIFTKALPPGDHQRFSTVLGLLFASSSILVHSSDKSDRARAASPTVSRLLATAVTDPSFESAVASALVAELLDFAATCRLDYATALVAESESASPPSVGGECALGTDVLEDGQEDFDCLAAAVPRFASMLLAPEGDPDALDIPTPHAYAEAITGPYSSQWQAAMDAEMASWKSPGTYIDEVPPPGANIVNGMWIFRRDYELHSLDFNTAFLQGSLHEEIWLHRPPGFTGSFPAGTQWSLRRPVYGLGLAPRKWHDTLMTTLAALGFAPSTADPSLFLRTDTSLPPFYVLVYVDDLVFATADTEALTLVQKRHICTDLVEVLQRFGFQFSSPEPTPLSTSHSLSAPPLDESIEPSGPYPELVGCLMYLMTCTRPELAYPLSLLARYVAPVCRTWGSCLEDGDLVHHV